MGLELLMLDGVHGIGKTTAINNLIVDYPLIKFINIDLPPGITSMNAYEGQLYRYDYYVKNLNHLLKLGVNIITDRSPLSFIAYSRASRDIGLISDDELSKLESVINIDNYVGRSVLLVTDLNKVISNIRKRNRVGFGEEDVDFLIAVHNNFLDLIDHFDDVVYFTSYDELNDWLSEQYNN